MDDWIRLKTFFEFDDFFMNSKIVCEVFHVCSFHSGIIQQRDSNPLPSVFHRVSAVAGLEPATFSYCSTDRCLPGLEPTTFSYCSTDRYLPGLEPATFSYCSTDRCLPGLEPATFSFL